MPTDGLVPEMLTWHCRVCEEVLNGSPETAATHLQSHGYDIDRWPDGSVALDMSDVPELLTGDGS